jgi:hypothetical protein
VTTNASITERLNRTLEQLYENDPETWAPLVMPEGSAAQRLWNAEDGWIIVYTTERVDRGRWADKFVTMLYKPHGKGARSGKAEEWRRTYARAFSSRKAAKARALDLYSEHSPKWLARHGKFWRR